MVRSLEVEVASQGKTEKEAIKNLREALELYFEDEPKADLLNVKDPKVRSFSLNA